jgi:hypothetical protein
VSEQFTGKRIDRMRVSTRFRARDACRAGFLVVVVVVSPARFLVTLVVVRSIAVIYEPIVNSIMGI